jgi:PAS domain S-box-containing protein
LPVHADGVLRTTEMSRDPARPPFEEEERHLNRERERRMEAAAILSHSAWWARERRREAESALLAALDEQFATTGVAVIATDLAGLVTHWNLAAETLYGWRRDEVLGRPITDLTVGPSDQQLAAQIMDAVERTGCWEGRFDVHRKDGTSFAAHVIDIIVQDEERRPIGIAGFSWSVPAYETRH